MSFIKEALISLRTGIREHLPGKHANLGKEIKTRRVIYSADQCRAAADELYERIKAGGNPVKCDSSIGVGSNTDERGKALGVLRQHQRYAEGVNPDIFN